MPDRSSSRGRYCSDSFRASSWLLYVAWRVIVALDAIPTRSNGSPTGANGSDPPPSRPPLRSGQSGLVDADNRRDAGVLLEQEAGAPNRQRHAAQFRDV